MKWPFERKKKHYANVSMTKSVAGMNEVVEYSVSLNAPDDYEKLISHALGAIDSLENGIEIEEEKK